MTGIFVPNLNQWLGSAVIVDPTGDTATETAKHRATEIGGKGQKVFVLDPYKESDVDESLRARFNPLDMLDPKGGSVVRDAERIAAALVSPDENEEPWAQNGARRLISGLVLYVLAAPVFEGRRNLVTVRDLAYRGDTQMRDYLHKQGKAENASAFDLLWAGMSSISHENEELCDVVAGAGEEFARMASSAPPQWTGVHDAALSATNFINNRDMRECLSRSDFDLSSLKSDPNGVSVYLTVPSRDKVEDFRWLRLLISQILSHLESMRERSASGHDVLFMLDEFASLQKMDRLEAGIAEIAKYGVKLCLVLQNLGQLRRHYQEGWETFLANCGTKVFFGVDDKFTREYVSELIGETEIIRTTGSTGLGKSTSQSQTDTSGTSRSEQETESKSKSDSYRRGKFNLRDTVGFFRKLGGAATASDTTQSGTSTGTSSEESSASGTSSSQESSSSRTEQIFKRPLVTPDEVGKLFQRIDDKEHPLYPGAAIVISSDHPDPMMLRRQNYFDEISQDDSFYDEDSSDPRGMDRPNSSEVGNAAPQKNRNETLMEPTPGFQYPFNTDPQHLAFRAKVRNTDIHKNGPDWHSDFVLDARYMPVASIPWNYPDNPKTPRSILNGPVDQATRSIIDWYTSVIREAENYHQRNCTISMRVRGELADLWNYLTDYGLLGHALDKQLISPKPNKQFEVGKRIDCDTSVRGSEIIVLSGAFQPNRFELQITSPRDSDRSYEMFGWRRITAAPLAGGDIKVEYTRLNYKKKRLLDVNGHRFLGYALSPDSVENEALKMALGYHAYTLFGEGSVRAAANNKYIRDRYSKDGFTYFFYDDFCYAHDEVTYEYYPEVLQGTLFERPFLAEEETPVAFCNYSNRPVENCKENYSRYLRGGEEIVTQYVPNGARLPLFEIYTPTFLVRTKTQS